MFLQGLLRTLSGVSGVLGAAASLVQPTAAYPADDFEGLDVSILFRAKYMLSISPNPFHPQGGQLTFEEPLLTVRLIPETERYEFSNRNGTGGIDVKDAHNASLFAYAHPVQHYLEYALEESFISEWAECAGDTPCFIRRALNKARNHEAAPATISEIEKSIKMEVEVRPSLAIVQDGQSSLSFRLESKGLFIPYDPFSLADHDDGDGDVLIDGCQKLFYEYKLVDCSVRLAEAMFIDQARDGTLRALSTIAAARAMIDGDESLRVEFAEKVQLNARLAEFDDIAEQLENGVEVNAGAGLLLRAASYVAGWLAGRLEYAGLAAWIKIARDSLNMPAATPQVGPPDWLTASPYFNVPTAALKEKVAQYKAAIAELETWPQTESVWASIQTMEGIVEGMERVIVYRERSGLPEAGWKNRVGGPTQSDSQATEDNGGGGQERGEARSPIDQPDPGDSGAPDFDDDHGSGGSQSSPGESDPSPAPDDQKDNEAPEMGPLP